MSGTRTQGRIRVGVIGASSSGGWAMYAHLPALQALPQFELTAVSTTRKASAEETARRFGVPHAFEGAEALVTHPDVDLVVVSVKTPEHDRWVRAAIHAGKHVFCEWPLGASLAQTTALHALAEKAGVRHAIGLQRRLAPSVRYLKDLLAEGYLGKLRSVTLHAAMPPLGARRAANVAYTADVANGASALTIFTAHYLDMVLHAVGEPREFSAVVARQFDHTTIIETGEVLPVSTPDQVLLSGTLRNGAVLSAHFEAGKRNGGSIRWTLTGTEGDLVVTDDYQLLAARGDGQALEPLPIPERYSWLPLGALDPEAHRMAHVYAGFARDLAEGTRTAPDFTDAVNRYRLLDAIQRSSDTGQRQVWNG
ncbi:Gfo/Idh/MocA family oxidoreductase [Myxococcaceae bacterium JPH2]|nr:Gfo/Idh/MocA family oxidoreductase [Myxococcaceae bacterium JPH2]